MGSSRTPKPLVIWCVLSYALTRDGHQCMGLFFDAECEHLFATRPADAIARKIHRESTCLNAGKLITVGGSRGGRTPWQNGRIRSLGGLRQPLVKLGRTSLASPSGTAFCPISMPTLRSLHRQGDKIQIARRSSTTMWVETRQKCSAIRKGEQAGVSVLSNTQLS